MRTEKINEIMDLLKGDPRHKPQQILISPIGFDNDNCEYCVQFKGKRPSVKVQKEEAERLIKLYPDIWVLKIIWDKSKPERNE